jgi:hypothetical protein
MTFIVVLPGQDAVSKNSTLPWDGPLTLNIFRAQFPSIRTLLFNVEEEKWNRGSRANLGGFRVFPKCWCYITVLYSFVVYLIWYSVVVG